MTTATSELTALTAGTWKIDPAHSEIGFTVRHLGLSKVRGRFNAFSGTATIAADQTASSVSASIDLSSVDTNNEMRDGHLQTGDFFNAETQTTNSLFVLHLLFLYQPQPNPSLQIFRALNASQNLSVLFDLNLTFLHQFHRDVSSRVHEPPPVWISLEHM